VDREGIPPSPAVPVDRMVALGRPELRRIIAEGGATMPGFAGVLTPAQVDQLVAYLVTGDG
jgi:mono/diheme cytochrome c family protein